VRRFSIKGAVLVSAILLLALPLTACGGQQKAAMEKPAPRVTRPRTATPSPTRLEQQGGAQGELTDANIEINSAALDMDSLLKEMDQIDPGQDNPQGL